MSFGGKFYSSARLTHTISIVKMNSVEVLVTVFICGLEDDAGVCSCVIQLSKTGVHEKM